MFNNVYGSQYQVDIHDESMFGQLGFKKNIPLPCSSESQGIFGVGKSPFLVLSTLGICGLFPRCFCDSLVGEVHHWFIS